MKHHLLLMLLGISLGFACTQSVSEPKSQSKPEFESQPPSDYSVQSITMVNSINDFSESQVPMLQSVQKEDPVVDKINASILEQLMLKSFKPEEIDEFRWDGLNFQSEIKDDILFIKYSGEFYGAYLSFVESELFYNLQTGDELVNIDLSFETLFRPESYLEFMDKYWLNKAKPVFQEAINCSHSEPYCSYYDIDTFQVSGNNLVFSLTDNCYAHVNDACSPELKRKVPIEELKPYLSPFGSKALLEDEYTQKQGIAKYIYNQEIQDQLPHHIYLFGKIDGKYPFSMAVQVNEETGVVDGYYFYDEKREDIQLRGTQEGQSIELTESVDGENTGHFVLEIYDDYVSDAFFYSSANSPAYRYITALWSGPQKAKSYPVEIYEVKLTYLP